MEDFIFWTFIAYSIFGIACIVYLIGKPREPLSNGAAAFSTVITALQLIGVWYLYMH